MQRTAVIVAGMHRSGTSALARVLSMLGCDLPKTLMGAGDANATGHWESEAISRFNDALLDSAGSRWNDWLAINPRWRESPKAAEFKHKAQTLLAHEFGDSGLFVLKDPRLCRLLSFWLDVIDEAGVRPVLFVPVRNPLEVAASLEARDGIAPDVGHLLWLRHVLDVESASRGRARFYCSYDGLLASWAELAQKAEVALTLSFPRLSLQTAAEVGDFLEPGRRHHRAKHEQVAQNPLLSAWLREAYRVFSAWSEQAENTSDYAVLDRIRAEFDAAGPAFAALVERAQVLAGRVRALEQANSQLQSQIREAQGLQREIERLMEAERGRQTEVQLMQREGEAAWCALAEKEAALAGLRADLASAQARLQDLESRAADAQRLQAELDVVHTRLEERDRIAAEAERLLAREREHAREIAVLSQLLREQQGAAQCAEHEAADLRSRLANAESAHAQQHEELRVTLEGVRQALAGKEQALYSTQTRLIQTEARLNERFAEIAALTRLLREREAATEEREWLRRVAATLLAGGDGWRGRLARLLPIFVLRAWADRHLRRQGLFDADAYRRANPDVARAGVNALRHYIHHGMIEGRRRDRVVVGRGSE